MNELTSNDTGTTRVAYRVESLFKQKFL